MDIQNKTILITGANRGIGRALVSEALKRGAKKIYAATRTPSNFEDDRVVNLSLDVTDLSQIRQAAASVLELDLLINNAGIANYEDLSSAASIEQHLKVNFFGPFHVTQAFLPHLKRSAGAVANNLSVVALAPFPVIPSYSISKAAAFNMTQSLRTILAPQGVKVHAVLLGPVNTDMSRGADIPKASPEDAAVGIFNGLKNQQDDIFPDPMSASLADAWRNGAVKAMEREFAALAKAIAASTAA